MASKPNRVEAYRETIVRLIHGAYNSDDYQALSAYLVTNSRLPGPRGNLELAEAFADVAVRECAMKPEALWKMAAELLRYSADIAPANTPKEFLPFCAICSLGKLGAAFPNFSTRVAKRLRQAAEDVRWRAREGVAWAMQRMLASHPKKTLHMLETWIAPGSWLVMRAVVAAVAEPSLLREAQTAQRALALHREVLAQVMAARNRATSEFRTLRQGLSYSLSIVVQALPQEGFEYLQELVDSRDHDILQIVKASLGKKRLSNNFPSEVAAIASRLDR